MQKLISIAILIVVGYFAANESGVLERRSPASSTDQILQEAFDGRKSDLQVAATGVVDAVLPDDNKGSRHQRFILRLANGQTVLIAHNIDLAPRVEGLSEDDRVEVYGEYEWNPKGGVIHWTHADPQGRHAGGWVRHGGRKYQ